MSLTIGDRPLSSRPRDTVNYRIDGPAHRLLFEPFPRRVRAFFGGATVLDTTSGMLLHESNLLPQLYLPRDDVRGDLLTRTEHRTHCPFKGDASYWSVTVNGQTVDNALWSYLDPLPEAYWLRDQVALYWGSMDAWFDEDEEVAGHLRGGGAEPVGDLSRGGGHRPRPLVVGAQDRDAVRGEAADELGEQCAHRVDVLEVVRVVELDVGDDRALGVMQDQRAVGLVDLRHQPA